MTPDCICPECKQDLIDGEHIAGCSYILSPAEEQALNAMMDVLANIEISDEGEPKP